MNNNPGPQLVATGDDSFAVVEADGSISVRIQTTPRDAGQPFRVKHFRSSQEIVDADGRFYARTTDPEKATHICTLLVVWENMKKKQAGKSPAEKGL